MGYYFSTEFKYITMCKNVNISNTSFPFPLKQIYNSTTYILKKIYKKHKNIFE